VREEKAANRPLGGSDRSRRWWDAAAGGCEQPGDVGDALHARRRGGRVWNHQTDIVHVIRGVIEAESGAIEHYERMIEFTESIDPVTQDIVVAILRDEQKHRRLFEGFLREYEVEGRV
jgi:hypothetical protein